MIARPAGSMHVTPANGFDVAATPVELGRDAACALRVHDPDVSRRHARLHCIDGVLLVEDLGSTLGTFVNGQRIRSKSLREGDLVRFGGPTYRWNGRSLVPVAGGLAVELSNVSVSAVGRVLVRDVSLEIGPGRFVGLLGPSGSGKSTLLRGLAGLIEVDGSLRFDGTRRSPGAHAPSRWGIGFVPQDDVVHGTLTVRENLDFAARIRLPAGEAPAAVARVLDEVDLKEHVDKFAAILSGGQRKRLSVGIELLRRPRLLLLDEPTSGLDPASECRLVEGLRRLSRQGTTVLCTTHVLENSDLFDDVVVLGVRDGVGRLAYFGPPSAILESFARTTSADVYEACASGEFEPLGSSRDLGRSTASRDETPREVVDESNPEPDPGRGRSEPSSRELATLLVRRHLLAAYRDRQAVTAMVLQPVLLALLIDFTQFSPGRLTPVTFFTVVVALWLGLNNSARELVRERAHCVRDRLGGVPAATLFASKVAAFVAIGLAQVVLLWSVVRLGAGLTLATGDVGAAADLGRISFPWAVSMLLLAYLGGLGIGFLVSSLVATENAAVAALPLVLMPQLLLSAVATNQAQLPFGDRLRDVGRPLAVTFGEGYGSALGGVVDVASMPCATRAASLGLDGAWATYPTDCAAWVWVADLLHLLLIVGATWVFAWWAFQRFDALALGFLR